MKVAGLEPVDKVPAEMPSRSMFAAPWLGVLVCGSVAGPLLVKRVCQRARVELWIAR